MKKNYSIVNSTLFLKNIFFYLGILIISGFLIRFFYLPFDIPLTFDALYYFLYSTDTVFLGGLPNSWSPMNNGWPSFVSLFFFITPANETYFLMDLQRLISIVLSVSTTIPIFYICKHFFNKELALVGSSLFVFDPKLIQNSLLGITEPLFILLISSSFFLILSKTKLSLILSFSIAAFATMIRSEGIFFLLILSVVYFVIYRKNSRSLIRFLVLISLFILILTPMVLYRQDVLGSDTIVSRITNSQNSGFGTQSNLEIHESIISSFQIYFKFMFWILIPISIFFVPFGIYQIFKQKTSLKIIIISWIGLLSLPALYAYSIPAFDHRFLYGLLPIFYLISLFSVQTLTKKFNSHLVIISIIFLIFISSLLFLELNSLYSEHDVESLQIFQELVSLENFKGANKLHPESEFINAVILPEQWPFLSTDLEKVTLISIDNYDSMSEFISKNEDFLTHIIVDNKQRSILLDDISQNPQNYPYLIKVFDSTKFSYHVTAYEINYDLFNKLK